MGPHACLLCMGHVLDAGLCGTKGDIDHVTSRMRLHLLCTSHMLYEQQVSMANLLSKDEAIKFVNDIQKEEQQERMQ